MPPDDAGSPPEPKKRRTSDLINRIRESADKLEQQGSTRGDLKLLSRAIRELGYALRVFAPYRRQQKVTVFGSARTLPDAPAYQQAVEFGREVAAQGWMVITGAAAGIMEAGHVGAGREMSMGLNILLPFEQDANPIIEGDHKLVHMKYFFTRKLMFVKECYAVVCFPGGFGTLDEALEVLTLMQTGKRDLMPLVLIDPPGGKYWPTFHEFVVGELLTSGLISPEDLHLYKLTTDVNEAVQELVHFYRNYHSMRYVADRLVFRLRMPIREKTLDTLNRDFADILVRDGFKTSGPLPQEKDEPELAHLTRLVFHFNRRSHGRLRQLINQLNDETAE